MDCGQPQVTETKENKPVDERGPLYHPSRQNEVVTVLPGLLVHTSGAACTTLPWPPPSVLGGPSSFKHRKRVLLTLVSTVQGQVQNRYSGKNYYIKSSTNVQNTVLGLEEIHRVIKQPLLCEIPQSH